MKEEELIKTLQQKITEFYEKRGFKHWKEENLKEDLIDLYLVIKKLES